MSDVVATTSTGRVSGASAGGVDRFLGIPYAQPPVGPLRFAAPQPASPWEGVRPAVAFGPSPPQLTDGAFSGIVPGLDAVDIDEDCLTLNVWRPAGAADRPVLVWIAGGAFVTGGTALPAYDGARLAAEQDVVVVTLNYRLGALGFLHIEGAPANRGLMDQALALQWVAANAAAFGGDPACITVVGESAGAGSILHLLASELDVPVRRAVVMSPGVDMTLSSELAARVTERFFAAAGAADLDAVRALPLDTILAAQAKAAQQSLFDLGTMPFHPVVDGVTLKATPSVAFASGAAGDVDLLIGSTTNEMGLFPDPRAASLDLLGATRWTLQLLAARTDGAATPPDGARIASHYFSVGAEGGQAWASLQGDGLMVLPAARIADSHAGRTYAYAFAWSAPGDTRGAFHAIDIPFVFDAFDGTGWAEFLGIDESGRAVGRALRDAWAAFAATGDPSCEALGAWPEYVAPARRTMYLSAAPEVRDDPHAAIRQLWDGLWSPAGRPAPVTR